MLLQHNRVYHKSHVPDAARRELVIVVLVTARGTRVHDVVTLGVAGRLGVGCTLVSTVMLQEVKVKVKVSSYIVIVKHNGSGVELRSLDYENPG